MNRCRKCGLLMIGHPDWREVNRGYPAEGETLKDNDLLLITRGSLKCAKAALRIMNEGDYYHNNGAAEGEILRALEGKEE